MLMSSPEPVAWKEVEQLLFRSLYEAEYHLSLQRNKTLLYLLWKSHFNDDEFYSYTGHLAEPQPSDPSTRFMHFSVTIYYKSHSCRYELHLPGEV